MLFSPRPLRQRRKLLTEILIVVTLATVSFINNMNIKASGGVTSPVLVLSSVGDGILLR